MTPTSETSNLTPEEQEINKNRIGDKEQAYEMAHAEKPLRDAARDSETENKLGQKHPNYKEALDESASIEGEKAGQKYFRERQLELNKEDGMSEEERIEKIIKRAEKPHKEAIQDIGVVNQILETNYETFEDMSPEDKDRYTQYLQYHDRFAEAVGMAAQEKYLQDKKHIEEAIKERYFEIGFGVEEVDALLTTLRELENKFKFIYPESVLAERVSSHVVDYLYNIDNQISRATKSGVDFSTFYNNLRDHRTEGKDSVSLLKYVGQSQNSLYIEETDFSKVRLIIEGLVAKEELEKPQRSNLFSESMYAKTLSGEITVHASHVIGKDDIIFSLNLSHDLLEKIFNKINNKNENNEN